MAVTVTSHDIEAVAGLGMIATHTHTHTHNQATRTTKKNSNKTTLASSAGHTQTYKDYIYRLEAVATHTKYSTGTYCNRLCCVYRVQCVRV